MSFIRYFDLFPHLSKLDSKFAAERVFGNCEATSHSIATSAAKRTLIVILSYLVVSCISSMGGSVRCYSWYGRGDRTKLSQLGNSLKKETPSMASHSDKGVSPQRRPPFECITLLLQGGGALGAYQAGVYQALSEAKIYPNWVAGISIGSVNAAIIAGNAPEVRVEKLRSFWEEITTPTPWEWWKDLPGYTGGGSNARGFFDQASAMATIVEGVPGFFSPRMPPPWFQSSGSLASTSYYDTAPLRTTLERVVDFDRLNAKQIRLSVGAVNVGTGNFIYFDNRTHTLTPEHIMASGALPPGLPAIEIDGSYYWDGGMISNTPLQWVLEYGPRQDTLAFQVDLWSAQGKFPQNMTDVATRQKEIIFSSRTRENTDQFKNTQRLRHAASRLLAELPKRAAEDPKTEALRRFADEKIYNIVHLIYRSKTYEHEAQDYEFSRLSMEEHWKAGYGDTLNTLRHPQIFERPKNSDGVATFDFNLTVPVTNNDQRIHSKAR